MFGVQTNLVNRITILPRFFMHLTGICDYPYQTNIHKFTALLYFCPQACYLTPLVCYRHQSRRFLELWDAKVLGVLKIPYS